MPIELKVVDKPIEDLKLVVKDKNVKKIKLSVRKTLDGNLLVQDHHSINIVIVPDKGKIISFPKAEYSQDCYADQSDLFDFLKLNGVIKIDSINGGNIFGSLQAEYSTDKRGDEEPVEVVMLNIHNFLSNAKHNHAIHKKYIDDLENQLINPDADNSTELGEVPQDEFKGSIPKTGYSVKSVYRYNY